MSLPSIVEVIRTMALPNMLQTFIIMISIRQFGVLRDDRPVGVDLGLINRFCLHGTRPKTCLRYLACEINLTGYCAAVAVLSTLKLAYQRLILGWH